jgi:hypothetical protein
MKKHALILVGLFFALSSMVGCATSFKYTIKDTPVQPDLKPDKALIYVVRSAFFGFAVPFEVYNDGNPVGVTKGKTYFFFIADPGEHLITSKAENTSELKLAVAAGETYYIKQSVWLGFLYARNYLSILSKEEAQKEMEGLKYIETELPEK